MNIGFTGTRYGMTKTQMRLLTEIIERFDIDEFHHGDCNGADEQAHNIVKEYSDDNLGRKTYIKIHVHPPIKDKLRAHCKARGEFIHEPRAYYDRNRDIVNSCDLIIATPKSLAQRDGGTWYTINYAKQKGKPVVILW